MGVLVSAYCRDYGVLGKMSYETKYGLSSSICLTCGVLVSNDHRNLHDRWHSRNLDMDAIEKASPPRAKLTPYAVLTCRAMDSDKTIREAYYKLAEQLHPDKNKGHQSDRWLEVKEAYAAIKTLELRKALAESLKLLSGVCVTCNGAGTVGIRAVGGKIKICGKCGGAGRATK